MILDDTNLEIIRHLKDGGKSFKDISQEMHIVENTVRIRTNKLIEEGVLEIRGLVDPLGIPNHSLAIMGVKFSTTDYIKKGDEFCKLKGVVAVGVGTGRYDLVVIVLLNNNFPLAKFVTEEIGKVEDVQSTDTFMIYHGFNFLVPYVL
jgi:Lrp/AsnC family transcriptional regulator for asnA, asnC and gidA